MQPVGAGGDNNLYSARKSLFDALACIVILLNDSFDFTTFDGGWMETPVALSISFLINRVHCWLLAILPNNESDLNELFDDLHAQFKCLMLKVRVAERMWIKAMMMMKK